MKTARKEDVKSFQGEGSNWVQKGLPLKGKGESPIWRFCMSYSLNFIQYVTREPTGECRGKRRKGRKGGKRRLGGRTEEGEEFEGEEKGKMRGKKMGGVERMWGVDVTLREQKRGGR